LYGQFVSLVCTKSGVRSFNQSSMILCRGNEESRAGILLDGVSPVFADSNMTRCSVIHDGCAILAQNDGGSFLAFYLTIVRCSGRSILHTDDGGYRPTID
jgi:hypothetical protein